MYVVQCTICVEWEMKRCVVLLALWKLPGLSRPVSLSTGTLYNFFRDVPTHSPHGEAPPQLTFPSTTSISQTWNLLCSLREAAHIWVLNPTIETIIRSLISGIPSFSHVTSGHINHLEQQNLSHFTDNGLEIQPKALVS